jgi:hypothetical protein
VTFEVRVYLSTDWVKIVVCKQRVVLKVAVDFPSCISVHWSLKGTLENKEGRGGERVNLHSWNLKKWSVRRPVCYRQGKFTFCQQWIDKILSRMRQQFEYCLDPRSVMNGASIKLHTQKWKTFIVSLWFFVSFVFLLFNNKTSNTVLYNFTGNLFMQECK